MTDEQIRHMAERFLAWPLPEDFMPDNGISVRRPNYAPNVHWQPVGTNLFSYAQAETMVRAMIEGMPTQTDQQLREALGRVKLGLLARDSKGRVMSPVSNHRLIEIIDDALSSSSLTK